jgi:hypothetical protein
MVHKYFPIKVFREFIVNVNFLLQMIIIKKLSTLQT